jgi:serine/threonine protein kinase
LEVIQARYGQQMMDGLTYNEPRKSLFHLFPNASPEATDLMERLLQFNPEKRLTADEALRHPYVAQFHDPASEPSCDHVITIPIKDNEKVCPTVHWVCKRDRQMGCRQAPGPWPDGRLLLSLLVPVHGSWEATPAGGSVEDWEMPHFKVAVPCGSLNPDVVHSCCL